MRQIDEMNNAHAMRNVIMHNGVHNGRTPARRNDSFAGDVTGRVSTRELEIKINNIK